MLKIKMSPYVLLTYFFIAVINTPLFASAFNYTDILKMAEINKPGNITFTNTSEKTMVIELQEMDYHTYGQQKNQKFIAKKAGQTVFSWLSGKQSDRTKVTLSRKGATAEFNISNSNRMLFGYIQIDNQYFEVQFYKRAALKAEFSFRGDLLGTRKVKDGWVLIVSPT